MIHRKGFGRIISPDLRAREFRKKGEETWKKSIIVKPGEHAEVRLDRQFLRPANQQGYRPRPEVGTRSVLARLGLELFTTMESVHEVKTPDSLDMMHHGETPIRLRRGNSMARFYFSGLGKGVRHEEALRRMHQGDLVLGKGFKLLPSGMIEITPQRVVWEIPREAKRILEREHWAAGSKRKKLMKMLRRVEREPKTHRELGKIILTETSPIKLPHDMVLFFYKTTDGNSHHIHSLIIDPQFEGPVVLELAAGRSNVKPDKILARLMYAP